MAYSSYCFCFVLLLVFLFWKVGNYAVNESNFYTQDYAIIFCQPLDRRQENRMEEPRW